MWLKKNLILGMVFVSTSFAGMGQGLFEQSTTTEEGAEKNPLKINGYVRGSMMAGGEDFDYGAMFGEMALQTRLNGSHLYLFADVRFRKGIEFDKRQSAFELKEAYTGYTGEKLDVLLGQQIVSWGRVDGFNPTNNLTPNNYFFLSSEPDDQKMSNFMLRAKYRITDFTDLDMAIIPYYEPSVYRYDLFAINPNASFTDMAMPAADFDNMAFAARLNFDFPAIGFSLSGFRGYDTFYGFRTSNIDLSTGTPIITYTPESYKKTSIGADVAIPIGSWILRAEAAYNITEDYEDNMHIPNPNAFYVAGLEKTIKGITFIGQYIGKYTMDFKELNTPVLQNPLNPLEVINYANEMVLFESESFNRKIFGQQEEMNHAASLAITKNLSYETIQLELTSYYNFTSEEAMLRPKVQWRISDALSASLGGSWMSGKDGSTFYYASKILNGAFAELKISF